MVQGPSHGIRVVAERYRLEHALARGGMGTVWRGRDQKLDRAVAVKVLARELATISAARARFEREARVLAKLRSAHVVEVYDFGIENDRPYIVMELLEGESLAHRLRRTGPLPLTEAAHLFAQIGKGLKAAHAAALIHRDLKPSNIFLARRDDGEVVKLLDFGVVKVDDPTLAAGEHTVTGLLVGTPQYMSPEQARATREIDLRSDLWAAGVILYRMVAGENPFRGESVGDVVLKICSDELPRIHDVRPDLPPALADFFARAFERDPDRRFLSAEAMVQALANIVDIPEPGGSARGPLVSSVTGSSLPPWRPPAASLPDSLPSSLIPGVPSFHSYDATPTPSTVGGTQLPLPVIEPVPRPSRQPLAIVIGAIASLVVVAFAAMVWIGSEPSPPDPAATDPAPAAPGPAAPRDDGDAEEDEAEVGDDPTGAGDTGATEAAPAAEPESAPATSATPGEMKSTPPATPARTASPSPPEPTPKAPPPQPTQGEGPQWF